MNAKERLMKTFNFEKVDRVPTYDLLMNDELYNKFGGSEGTVIERNARMMKAIGLDCTRGIYNPSEHWIKEKVRCWEKFLGIKPGGFEVSSGGGTSWFSKRPFNDIEGLKRNLPSMPKKDELANWYIPFLKQVKEVFDRYDLAYIGATEGPLTDAYDYVDLELFSIAIFDAPDEINYLLEVTTEWAKILAELYCEFPTSNAFFMGDDIAYKTGTIFSPTWLKENVYSRWKSIYQPLKDKGIKCIYHSDGNLYSVLDDLVKEIGIDGLNPIEPTADMDIIKISKMYPDLVLLGNIDTATVLSYGSPEEVKNATHKLLKEMNTRGGLLLGSSTEVSDAVPVENILAMYKAARDYKGE